MPRSVRKGKSEGSRTGAETARAGHVLRLLLLAALPLAVFLPVFRSEFIAYDDSEYVTSNVVVRRGLTLTGIHWAFTTGHAANWHPLTWLSHMADVSLFGLNPAGHHATNLALHVANTLLLYFLLRRLTDDPWPSAWAAALFAVHPAHVQSVAWIAERKDLLSTVFWLATTWAYVSWVRRRNAGHYLVIVALFAAGLMSKPMLVSLPVTLLLLDYWPLERLGRLGDWPRLRALLLEKVPLFLMAAASSIVTFAVQRAGGAVRSLESFPLSLRVGNAIVACVRYLGMLFWPADLAVFYPHPGRLLSLGKVLPAALLLLAFSAAAVALRRRAPFLFVGWFWFLVTLVPVVGLVQVGLQALADRYTYVPFIGLFVAVAWEVPAVVSGRRYGRPALRAAAAAVVLTLALAAAAQVRVWKNSETLFLHALRITKDNATIQNNLGDYYNNTGRPADAVPHLIEAIRIRPRYQDHYTNLGRSLFLLGRLDEAAEQFSHALILKPNDPTALNNLARTRFVQGEIPEAVRLYEAAVAAAPDWAEPRRRLAVGLLMEGKTAAALSHLQRCVAVEPAEKECRQLLDNIPALDRKRDDPAAAPMLQFLAAAHRDASVALQRRGKRALALAHLHQAVDLLPCSAEAHSDLGALLVQEGRLDEAAAEIRLALDIDPESAVAHNDLGYIFFLEGRREAAIKQYVEALRLQPGLALAQANLELARRGQPEERTDGGGSSVTPGPR
jgi:protein O-mannosyl-transferase